MQKTVTINANVGNTYEVSLTTRHFSMKVDQPKPSGNDAAPTPLEYFLFALGACTCTIGKIVAEQRKIKLNAINANVEGDIDTNYLLGKTKEGRAGFTNIRIKVEVDADLNDEEKIEFINEVLHRCPIHDNIENSTNISVGNAFIRS